MDTNKRKQHQDIYSTDRTEKDLYTPQYSNTLAEERKRDYKRQKSISFILGISALTLSIGLVYVIVNTYVKSANESAPRSSYGEQYIPRYSLSGESQWVLDFNRSFASTTWNGDGERPFNRIWLKKLHTMLSLEKKHMI